eukprot:587341-Pleurochrysis_carterae.AAC.1
MLSTTVAARPPLRRPSFAVGGAELACVVGLAAVGYRPFAFVVLLSWRPGFHFEGVRLSVGIGEKTMVRVT